MLHFSDSTYKLDGKRLDTYSWQWEASNYPGVYNTQTVIHETGHALGLPDYYDYDPSVGPKGGLGGLDMMDSTWGDHNCFSKFLLDWITPTTFNSGTHTVNLNPSGGAEDAVLVMPNITSGNHFAEFFMIQNRFRTGNDISYTHDGLLIWHVDARLNSGGYNFSYDNSYTGHKLIRLMEADGLEEIETGNGSVDAGDYYVGGKNFGSLTVPNSDRYDGSPTGISVHSIVTSGNTMSLEVSLPLACVEAIPIERKIVYYDTTVGAVSNIKQYGCKPDWDKSGPEKIYQVTTTIAGDLSATLSNLTADLDVFILNDCDPASCVAYGDTQAVYPNAPPGTYYIVVDGSKNVSGSFALTVDYPSGGLACEEAVLLGRNVPYNGTTVGGPTKVKSYGCDPSWNESGPERIHKIVTTGYGDIMAELTNMTADVDLDVFILDACDPYRCVAHGTSSALYPDAPPGTYYIIVDGYESASGSYTLTVDFGPPELNCDAAIPMVRFVPYNGTTVGAPDKVRRYSCASDLNESGPERVHQITTTISGDITATLSNLTNDLDVFILSACDAASCVANGDNSATYTNAPPGTYYIVVDGYYGGVGDYTLNVSYAVPPPVIQLGSSDLIVQENGGNTSVTVNLSKVFDLPVYVDYATIGQTATAGSDFTPASGKLTFALGETTKTLTLPIINDALWEPANETFRLTLSNPVNGVLGTPNQALVSIVDNDEPPTVQLNAPTYTVQENGGLVSMTVTLSHTSESLVTVGYATSDGTAIAGKDYTAAVNAQLIFAPGETSKTFTIPIIDDAIDEPNETFNLVLSNPVNAVLGTPSQAVLTIVDNDPPPTVQLSSATYTVNENVGPATVTVSLTVASGYPVQVDYATSDGTALKDSDYRATKSTLIFAPGETSKTIQVPIIDDTIDEPDETFNVVLSNPVNAVLGTPSQAVVTIVDNDLPPTVIFSSATYTVNENGGSATITVGLSVASGYDIQVNYATSDGTALAGSDYTETKGKLIFPPGQTSRTFTVPIIDDAIDEPDKTVNILLSGPVNASLGAPSQAVLTIVDNDSIPNVQFSSPAYSIKENGGSAIITVRLNNPSGVQVTVGYATNNGTAASGSDYTAASGILTFAPGETSKTFAVAVMDNKRYEPNKTVNLALNNQVNAFLGSPIQATLTIVEDDPPPTIADLNGDRKAEILWHNQVTGNVMAWSLEKGRIKTIQFIKNVNDLNWKIVGTGDFDGDGNPDILWHNRSTGAVYVWYMSGATFLYDQPIRTVEDTNWKVVGVGDFDRDGHPDILWQNEATGAIYVWYMDGANYLYDQHIRTVPDLNWKVVGVGDCNGDGFPDIYWHNQMTGAIYVWYMNGPTFLYDQHIRTVPDLSWKIISIDDYDGDGNPDILWKNQVTGPVYIWNMDGANFVSDQPLQGGSGNKGIVDFDWDGNPDILWQNQATGQVYVWYMNGGAFMADQFIRTVPDTNWKIEGVGDFNGDGNADIVWRHQVTGDVYVWYMSGASFAGDQLIRRVEDTNWKIEGVGDFNGDGQMDILWRHQVTGDVYVWYMSGASFVSDQFIRRVDDPNWRIVGAADFNGDGQTDILWQNQATGAVYAWYMNGKTFLSDQHIRTVSDTNWKIEGIADFNGDGNLDILWRHQVTGDVYIWSMNGATFLHDQFIRRVGDTNWKIVN